MEASSDTTKPITKSSHELPVTAIVRYVCVCGTYRKVGWWERREGERRRAVPGGAWRMIVTFFLLYRKMGG